MVGVGRLWDVGTRNCMLVLPFVRPPEGVRFGSCIDSMKVAQTIVLYCRVSASSPMEVAPRVLGRMNRVSTKLVQGTELQAEKCLFTQKQLLDYVGPGFAP